MIAWIGGGTGTGTEPHPCNMPLHELCIALVETNEEIRARRRIENMKHERTVWSPPQTRAAKLLRDDRPMKGIRQASPRERCRQHQAARR